jgi:hypothetical protein
MQINNNNNNNNNNNKNVNPTGGDGWTGQGKMAG